MKKRLFSLLLCFALLGSMVVFPVGAETQATDDTMMCPCGCGNSLNQITWNSYESVSTTQIPGGHYRLSADYAQKSQRTINSTETVVLDLNGSTLTTADYHRLYLIYGNLYVVDTVGGGRMMAKTTGSSFGGVVMLSTQNSMPSLLEIYNITLTVDADNKSSARGGLISVSTNSTFRMFGGVISDGTTIDTDGQAAQGGAIAAIAASALVELDGTTVINCSSASDGGSIYSVGTTTLKNCKILGGSANGSGGNICQSSGSLTLENCEIAYGSAYGSNGGGNIYISGNMTDSGSTIRDGFASGGTGNGGGNLYFNKGEHTLKGTTIQGGVSYKYGANILNWSSEANTRLEDCTISGDVRWSGSGLTLAGKTKIGLGNNGLNLAGGSSGSVISAGELTEGAEIFVCAAFGTFTSDAVNANYFKPALRTVLSQNTDGTLGGKFAASEVTGGYCPHCYNPDNPQKVIWTAFGDGVFQENCLSDKTDDTDPQCTNQHLASGHYYLSQNVSNRFNVPSGADVTIDLNGKKISSSHRVFVIEKNAAVSILDLTGTGTVTGKGGSTSNTDGSFSLWNGGVIFGATKYSFNLYGGQLIYQPVTDSDGNINANKHIASGGVIYAPAGSLLNIHGGTINGSAYNLETTNYVGGAISLHGGTFTMSAGRILGGKANLGGTLYFDQANTLNISGGVISGGSSKDGGGNLRLGGAASTANIRNCAILDGSATTNGGGNINNQQATTNLDNCYIVGGSSSNALGGNLRLGTSAKGLVKNTIFAHGSAIRGGNVYAAATNLEMTFENCLITTGTATSSGSSSADGCGGNIFANNGILVFRGGEISFGTAAASGGNLHIYTGNNTVGNKVVFTAGATAPRIIGGSAASNGGNINHLGVAEYNDAFISNGAAGKDGQDIYLGSGAKTALVWGSGVTGEQSVYVDNNLLAAPVYGKAIPVTTANAMNAFVILEGHENTPRLFCVDGKLAVAATANVDESGQHTWYPDNTAAVASRTASEYIKLYTDMPLQLSEDVMVDLNGQTVAVSGGHTLYGMDSSGDDFTVPAGKAILADNTQTVALSDTSDGRSYLAVVEDRNATFHRLEMGISHIVLRPESAGIYYKATWSCDSEIAQMVTDYGISVSLKDMPGQDLKTAENNITVSFTDTITAGRTGSSVLVNGIMDQEKSAVENDKNAKLPIYATAYIAMSDGTLYTSNRPDGSDDVCYSLYSLMKVVDEMIQAEPLTYRQQEKALQKFYETWLERGMEKWQFQRMNYPTASGPLCDGKTLKILAMTSSFGLNTTQLLYDIAKAEGCENVIVARLYSSGCTLQQHVKNLTGNLPGYQYTKNDSGKWVTRENTTLEYGLTDEDWDIIFIQQGAAQAALVSTYGDYLDTIFEYLEENKTNPAARYIWNMTWAYQGDSDQKVFVETFKSDQMAMYQSILNAVQTKIVGRPEFSAIIPSGTAIQNARTSYFGDTLTKDTYHLNNLGRAIAGYTLWATITEKPLTKVDLGPVNSYDLPEMLELSDSDRQVIIDVVNNALAKPFEVTPSAYPTK